MDKIGFLRKSTPQFLIWIPEGTAFGLWPKLFDPIVKPKCLVAIFNYWRKKQGKDDFASVFKH